MRNGLSLARGRGARGQVSLFFADVALFRVIFALLFVVIAEKSQNMLFFEPKCTFCSNDPPPKPPVESSQSREALFFLKLEGRRKNCQKTLKYKSYFLKTNVFILVVEIV